MKNRIKQEQGIAEVLELLINVIRKIKDDEYDRGFILGQAIHEFDTLKDEE